MSSSIIDFVNCHTEKENGDNKYINDKFLDVKELNSEDMYISKKLNLQGVVPANSLLATDANFNIVGGSIVDFNQAYRSYSNGVNPNPIDAGSIVSLDFGIGGTLLSSTPNIVYNGLELTINSEGFYLFSFSALIRVSAPTTTGYFNLYFTNPQGVGSRIIQIGRTYGIPDVNMRQLISVSFITDNRIANNFWGIECENTYPTQTVNIDNITTTIYKIANIPP